MRRIDLIDVQTQGFLLPGFVTRFSVTTSTTAVTDTRIGSSPLFQCKGSAAEMNGPVGDGCTQRP